MCEVNIKNLYMDLHEFQALREPVISLSKSELCYSTRDSFIRVAVCWLVCSYDSRGSLLPLFWIAVSLLIPLVHLFEVSWASGEACQKHIVI